MQMRVFAIPSQGDEDETAALNQSLGWRRIVSVDRIFASGVLPGPDQTGIPAIRRPMAKPQVRRRADSGGELTLVGSPADRRGAACCGVGG